MDVVYEGIRQKGMNMSHSCLILCRTKNIKTRTAMDKELISFEQVVERGCGLDVHKETVVATIQGKGIKTITKSYSTFTGSLEKLRDWLKKHGITHIAMESTG